MSWEKALLIKKRVVGYFMAKFCNNSTISCSQLRFCQSLKVSLIPWPVHPPWKQNTNSYIYPIPKKLSNDVSRRWLFEYYLHQRSPFLQTPRAFNDETTWKRLFSRGFNVEYTWCAWRVCLGLSVNVGYQPWFSCLWKISKFRA